MLFVIISLIKFDPKRNPKRKENVEQKLWKMLQQFISFHSRAKSLISDIEQQTNWNEIYFRT